MCVCAVGGEGAPELVFERKRPQQEETARSGNQPPMPLVWVVLEGKEQGQERLAKGPRRRPPEKGFRISAAVCSSVCLVDHMLFHLETKIESPNLARLQHTKPF